MTMPEARDRLIRENPITPWSRRRSVGGVLLETEPRRNVYVSPVRFTNGGGGGIGGGPGLFGSPVQMRSMAMMNPRVAGIRGSAVRRFGYGSPLIGQENRGRGRVRNNSSLPSWYPRTPLRDITRVVNAIERRRAYLRETEQRRLTSPSPRDLGIPEPNQPAAGAPLEHNISLTCQSPLAAATPRCQLPVHHMPKSLLGNHVADDADFLTPQKRLLESIDQVEKVVMEELQKMKRTPTAKKAERAKKVRTLMAMR